MNQTTLQQFADDPENHLTDLRIEHFERLLKALVQAERPESLQRFFWYVLILTSDRPELKASFLEHWKPDEESLAQLLEDAGRDEASVVLAVCQRLPSSKQLLTRLLDLSEKLRDGLHAGTSEPWEQIARIPMMAWVAEQQLDQLIEAVAQGLQWKNPADILDPEGNYDLDLESILTLAQARMAEPQGSGEALNLVVLRLLHWTDEHKNTN